MTEVVVQLRDAEPRNPVPAEVRMRQALKALLRHYGLRAEWAPTLPAAGGQKGPEEGKDHE